MPFISSRGVSIHYEVEGDPAAPPLMLHHGWTSDIESWRDFGYVRALEERFRLIMIDARGHGLSDVPENSDDYDPELFVADVEAVLNAVGIESVIFWGYSMGAAIGFQLAVSTPGRIDRFIAGGMHPYGNSPGDDGARGPRPEANKGHFRASGRRDGGVHRGARTRSRRQARFEVTESFADIQRIRTGLCGRSMGRMGGRGRSRG